MSRKRKDPCRDGEVYWGTFDYNRRLLDSYLNQIIQLGITRYEWRGLPSTVDPIWLERELLLHGQATIAQPVKDGKRGLWYAARVATMGPLTLYDRPLKWQAYQRDNFRFDVTARNGVIVYDNVTRTCIYDALELAARELVDIQKTKQVNRFWQKLPFILVTPADMELTATNLLSNIMAGQPATVANPQIRDIDAYKLDMQVPYIGGELTAAEQNVLNRIYTMLGIANVTFKSERMIEDEVRSMSEPSTKMSLSGLIERRRAAERLNDQFGLNVSVIWRTDNESENVNAVENVEKLSRIVAGETKGVAEVLGNES